MTVWYRLEVNKIILLLIYTNHNETLFSNSWKEYIQYKTDLQKWPLKSYGQALLESFLVRLYHHRTC